MAIRTPHALKLPRVRVIHHHAAVAIPVRHEQFVGFGVDTEARPPLENLGSVAASLAALADGHHEFARLRELENLVVVGQIRGIVPGAIRVSHDPHEALVIYGDGVLVRRPLISRPALPTPALDEVARVVELHHGRRGCGFCVGRR